MSVEQRLDHPPTRRPTPHTYFVGRREFGAAEVYAVTAAGVHRLTAVENGGSLPWDWHGSDAGRLELSHAMIGYVADAEPTVELRARFALYVLERLPDDGFVLDSDEIWRWLRVSSEPEDFLAGHPARRSWAGRLRTALFRGAATTRAHA